jgi:hypothetical protein
MSFFFFLSSTEINMPASLITNDAYNSMPVLLQYKNAYIRETILTINT